jgi:hypothetical protein
MVVFKVVRKSDNSVIGYRLDTMGSLGTMEQAKRYSCETDEEIERQRQIIDKNLKTMLNETAEQLAESFIVGPILKAVKLEFYDGLTSDDVELTHEVVPYVERCIKIHTVTVVDANGVTQY